MIHPFLKNRKTILSYITAWVLVAGTHFFVLVLYRDLDAPYALADASVYNILLASIGLVLWYPVRFIDTEKSSRLYIALNHLVAAMVSVFVWIGLGTLFCTSLVNDPTYSGFVRDTMPWRIIIGAFFYLIIIMIFYLMVYYRNMEEKARNEARLETLVRESELNMLRSQINPHFLFNSLNSISSLTLVAPDKAREMIVKLSEFLRYALDHGQHEKSTLGEEIKNIERYLHIEQVRFGEKLNFIKEVPEKCLSYRLPNMVLQPLFENAIKHGVYESTQPVTIHFSCVTGEKMISLRLTNNYDPEYSPGSRKGIGLKNISDRLRIMYGRDDLMKISREGNIFVVNLIIPQEGS